MDVRNLPAVVEATSVDGIFTKAQKWSFVHPNKGAAKRVLSEGTVPIEKFEFLKRARTLSAYEIQNLKFASNQMQGIPSFSRVFVVDTKFDYVVSFGSYLIIDEDTLYSPYNRQILAHELAHVRNGDSYVKAAMCFLGQGWMQETMEPFGFNEPTPEEKHRQSSSDMEDFVRGLLFWGWKGAAAVTLARMFRDVGTGVLDHIAEVDAYFHRWDILADAVAERWVGALEYQAYLESMSRTSTRTEFDASSTARQHKFEERRVQPISIPQPRILQTSVSSVASLRAKGQLPILEWVFYLIVGSPILIVGGLILLWILQVALGLFW